MSIYLTFNHSVKPTAAEIEEAYEQWKQTNGDDPQEVKQLLDAVADIRDRHCEPASPEDLRTQSRTAAKQFTQLVSGPFLIFILALIFLRQSIISTVTTLSLAASSFTWATSKLQVFLVPVLPTPKFCSRALALIPAKS